MDPPSEAQSFDVAPAFPSFLSNDEDSVLRIEEGRVIRGTTDGEVCEEEGEAELSEGFGDEEEMGGVAERVGI